MRYSKRAVGVVARWGMPAGRASIAFKVRLASKSDWDKVDLTLGRQRMNPLRWKREYQVAWIAFCLIGGMAGLFFAWIESTGRKLAISDTLGLGAQVWFFAWLTDPSQYWQWPFFGAVFVGLIFYAAMLVVVRSK
jgi:hypothetical protein